jgi:hypothetical protein
MAAATGGMSRDRPKNVERQQHRVGEENNNDEATPGLVVTAQRLAKVNQVLQRRTTAMRKAKMRFTAIPPDQASSS